MSHSSHPIKLKNIYKITITLVLLGILSLMQFGV